MLIPKVSLEVSNTCDKISIFENTGVYSLNTNHGGFGSPNIATTDITASKVEVFDLDSNLLETFDLTGTYPLPIVGEFLALNEVDWNQEDGIFNVVYTVTAGIDYTNSSKELFLCNLCNCRQNTVLKLIETCDGINAEKLKSQVDQFDLFIYGIETAYVCFNFDRALDILKLAQKYCENINCNNC